MGSALVMVNSFIPTLPSTIEIKGGALVKKLMFVFIKHTLPSIINKEVKGAIENKMKSLKKEHSSSSGENQKLKQVRLEFEKRLSELQERLSEDVEETGDRKLTKLMKNLRENRKDIEDAKELVNVLKKEFEEIEKETAEKQRLQEAGGGLNAGVIGIIAGSGSVCITLICLIVICIKY